MRSAVLLVGFNRPDTTAQVFEAIRAAAPPKLYVAVDGARDGRPDDVELREQVIAVVSKVDWECEVHTKFEPENLGCRTAVAEAIGWMLDAEGEGIILEDDTLPAPSFFTWCDDMLARHRDDPRVNVISGYNPVVGAIPEADGLGYASFPMIWGWATWKRVWDNYDVALDTNGDETLTVPPVVAKSRQATAFWMDRFASIRDGSVDTWDYQVVHQMWRERALAAYPAESLVVNLGFRGDATHTDMAPPRHVRETVLGAYEPRESNSGPNDGPDAGSEPTLTPGLDARLQERFFGLGLIPAARGLAARLIRR